VANINIDELKTKIQEQSESIGLNEIEIKTRLNLVDELSTLDPSIVNNLQQAINSIDFSNPAWLE